MKHIQEYKRFLFFLLVGALTTGIYFSIFTVMWKCLSFNYKIAVTIAYLISVVFHFIANRKVTFKNRNNNVIHQMAKFSVMLVINYILTMMIVTWGVSYLSISPYLGVILSL